MLSKTSFITFVTLGFASVQSHRLNGSAHSHIQTKAKAKAAYSGPSSLTCDWATTMIDD